MPAPGKLSYIAYGSSKGSRVYKPDGRVKQQKPPWEKVAFLWGDPVYVMSVKDAKAGTDPIQSRQARRPIPLSCNASAISC